MVSEIFVVLIISIGRGKTALLETVFWNGACTVRGNWCRWLGCVWSTVTGHCCFCSMLSAERHTKSFGSVCQGCIGCRSGCSSVQKAHVAEEEAEPWVGAHYLKARQQLCHASRTTAALTKSHFPFKMYSNVGRSGDGQITDQLLNLSVTLDQAEVLEHLFGGQVCIALSCLAERSLGAS